MYDLNIFLFSYTTNPNTYYMRPHPLTPLHRLKTLKDILEVGLIKKKPIKTTLTKTSNFFLQKILQSQLHTQTSNHLDA